MVERKEKNQLTRNQALVLKVLEKSKAPAGAYQLLKQLQGEGLRAPPQIYRALDGLVALGLAHRVESLNAFVACNHSHCSGHETVAFTICNSCGEVSEISDEQLTQNIRTLADQTGLGLTQSTVELRGICSACESD